MTLQQQTGQKTGQTSQAAVFRRRVQTVFRQANPASFQNETLAKAFEELALVLDALQVAETALATSNQEQLVERVALEQQLQSYQELFAYAPAGYLITRLDGTITQTNQAAASMFHTSQRQLIGRSLTLFVPDGQRRPFRQQIAELTEEQGVAMWEQSLQSWDEQPLTAMIRVGVARGVGQRPQALRWLLFPLPQFEVVDARQALEIGDETSQLTVERGLLANTYAFLADVTAVLASRGDTKQAMKHIARRAMPAVAARCMITIDPGGEQPPIVAKAGVVAGSQARRALAVPITAGERELGSLELVPPQHADEGAYAVFANSLARQIAHALTHAAT